MKIKVELKEIATGNHAIADCEIKEERVDWERLWRSVPAGYELITYWSDEAVNPEPKKPTFRY